MKVSVAVAVFPAWSVTVAVSVISPCCKADRSTSGADQVSPLTVTPGTFTTLPNSSSTVTATVWPSSTSGAVPCRITVGNSVAL